MKCRAALVTPPGRGAIATVVVHGAEAQRAVEPFFVPCTGRVRDEPPKPTGRSGGSSRRGRGTDATARLHYGRWGDELREEVVLHRRAEDVFEIHCHGGRAAARAILASLERVGCELLDWKQYVVNTESTIRAEALAALAAASTERAAGVLLDQLEGALEGEVRAIIGHLSVLGERGRGREGETRGDGGPRFEGSEVVEALEAILSRAKVGLHLVQPWRVVIAGRPNVGKSALINALLGYERAVTSEVPGTTRDAVTAAAALGGWPVELVDTAGLRQSADELEREGTLRADAMMRQADLCVLVFDRSEAVPASDVRLMSKWPNAVCVANKCDLPAAEQCPLPQATVPVSALTGAGVARLAEALAARLVPQAPAPGNAVPFTARQVDQLRQARARAQAGDWQRVAGALRGVVG